PRWMCAEEDLASKNASSIVVAFEREDDAREVLRRKNIFMFGRLCSASAYVDIPPIRNCERCGKLDHITRHCRDKEDTCLECSGRHSTTNHRCSNCNATKACSHIPAKCANCEGDHPAYSRRC
ncbi:hypothetical protein K474DRAFT_1575364, partial [Panus rudis PR-1116 ss-1]